MVAFDEDVVAACAEVQAIGSFVVQLLRMLMLRDDTPELANTLGLQWRGDDVLMVNENALAQFLGTRRNDAYHALKSMAFRMVSTGAAPADDATLDADWMSYTHSLVRRGCGLAPDGITWHNKYKPLPTRQ